MMTILAVTAWLAAVYRRPAGDRREPAAWALPATLATLALGLTLKVPSVYGAVGDLTGVPDLGQLIKDVSVVLSAFGTQVVLLHLLYPPTEAVARSRRRAPVPVLTVAAVVALFALAVPGATVEELRAGLAGRGLVEFRGIYLVFLAWACADIARLCWRFAGLAGDKLLATRLRLIAAGGAVGLTYVASGAVQVLAAGQHDLPLVQQAQRTSDALLALATLLVVLGSTLPPAAARLALRRQAPPGAAAKAAPPGLLTLWDGVTRALPEFVLPASARASLTAQEQLYRQVIEVEDARLALRSVRDAAVERAAAEAVAQHGVDESERGAAVEGVALALAVDRLRTGDSPLAMPVGLATAPPPLLGPGVIGPTATLDSEVAWLSSVGRWYGDESLTATAKHLLAGSHRAEAAHDHAG